MDPRELAFAGAAQQARMLADGTITAPALLDVYLERIGRLDRELRSYRVVLAEVRGRRRPPRRPGWTRGSDCRCWACPSPSRTTSTWRAR